MEKESMDAFYDGSKNPIQVADRLFGTLELLADREKTLTEVAMLSGFQSISSFNRAFRAEKNMVPGEYRELLMPPYPG